MLRRAHTSLLSMAFAGLVVTPLTAFAASDGTIGASSAGTLDIMMTIPQLVQISNLNDIDLGAFSGTEGLSGRDDVCVWSTTRAYRITATGGGDSGAFELSGRSGSDTLPYSVQWAPAAGESSGAELRSGRTLRRQAATNTSRTCEGGSALNASVIINITEEQLSAVQADTYSGTLSLLVEPQ